MDMYRVVNDKGEATTMTEKQVYKLANSWIDDINFMEPEGSPNRWEYPQDMAQAFEIVTEYLQYEIEELHGRAHSDWIRGLADKYTFEVIPELYERSLKEYGTVNGYSYASAFDALNIAHANGINITAGLENGTLRLITANERFALINLKKDDEKMTTLHVELTEDQIMELAQIVDIGDYVDFIPMIDWNGYMAGTPATEIIDSIDMNNFDTCDEYAVKDGLGQWVSSDSLGELLSPFLDEMLQDYLDNNLR